MSIEIECTICGEKLTTASVDKAVKFDREHREEHVLSPAQSGADQ